MNITSYKRDDSYAIEFDIEVDTRVIGFAFLIVIQNNRHDEPYGMLENVYIEEEFRGKGYGKKIVQAVIEKAQQIGCYKLIATSRYGKEEVHDLYLRLGFEDFGKEFRMDIFHSPLKQSD